MNFLAHLYLSDDSDGSRLGALYGDFMKGYRLEDFSVEIQQGIRLHQHIDTYTDSHLLFRQSKRRISSSRRRYAGILIDIFYDHFLAKYWADYSCQSLEEFAANVYQLLEANFDHLPGRLKHITPYLIQENWLMGYATENGLRQTFRGLSSRISRDNSVDESLQELQANAVELHADFCQFFPELQTSVLQFQQQQHRT